MVRAGRPAPGRTRTVRLSALVLPRRLGRGTEHPRRGRETPAGSGSSQLSCFPDGTSSTNPSDVELARGSGSFRSSREDSEFDVADRRRRPGRALGRRLRRLRRFRHPRRRRRRDGRAGDARARSSGTTSAFRAGSAGGGWRSRRTSRPGSSARASPSCNATPSLGRDDERLVVETLGQRRRSRRPRGHPGDRRELSEARDCRFSRRLNGAGRLLRRRGVRGAGDGRQRCLRRRRRELGRAGGPAPLAVLLSCRRSSSGRGRSRRASRSSSSRSAPTPNVNARLETEIVGGGGDRLLSTSCSADADAGGGHGPGRRLFLMIGANPRPAGSRRDQPRRPRVRPHRRRPRASAGPLARPPYLSRRASRGLRGRRRPPRLGQAGRGRRRRRLRRDPARPPRARPPARPSSGGSPGSKAGSDTAHRWLWAAGSRNSRVG